MRAMILAAGRGERLRPLTDRIPKPLIDVGGKPLIHHTLGYLKRCGVEEVVINLHHLGEQIQAFVGDGSRWGLTVFYSLERRLLGTGGGIQKSAHYLTQEAFVVINSDILLDLDLREVHRFHRENNGTVTLVLRRDPEVERYGVIEVDGHHQVKQMLGKLPIPPAPRKKLMFTGVHILEPDVFKQMPYQGEAFSIVDVYLKMLQAGERILGYEMNRFWADLGTPERYEDVKRRLESGDLDVEGLMHGCGEER